MAGDDPRIVLVSEHRGRIFAYLLAATRCRADAEDLTQETMLRAWRAYPQLLDPAAATAWLYRIATNLILERSRTAARRPQITEVTGVAGDRDQAANHDGLLRAEQREMSACIQSLADGLTEPQRAALLLHDGFGLTNPEIAEVLGCSVAAVKIRLHRARDHMTRLVERNCSLADDARGVLVCEPQDPDHAPTRARQLEARTSSRQRSPRQDAPGSSSATR